MYRSNIDIRCFKVTRSGLLRIAAALTHDEGQIRIFNVSWRCWGFSMYFGESRKDVTP